MNEASSGDGPEADADSSWANETLPLGVRRELLNRDLQKALGRRSHPKGEDNRTAADGTTSNQDRPGGDG